MNRHRDSQFEEPICDHLAASGWLYAAGDAERYDRARALFHADVIAWVQATQADAWETLTKTHGASAADVLLDGSPGVSFQTLMTLSISFKKPSSKLPVLPAPFPPDERTRKRGWCAYSST